MGNVTLRYRILMLMTRKHREMPSSLIHRVKTTKSSTSLVEITSKTTSHFNQDWRKLRLSLSVLGYERQLKMLHDTGLATLSPGNTTKYLLENMTLARCHSTSRTKGL